jgi:Lipase (class 3)
VSLPISVLLQANAITANIDKLFENEYKYTKFKRICITGHSLGGSIATAVFLNLKLKNKLSTEIKVYSFGSPYTVSCKNSTASLTAVEKDVCNVIYQLDVIPRLLGATKMPNYLFLNTIYNNEMIRSRSTVYSPFGTYIVAHKTGRIAVIKDISEFMNAFPSSEVDFAYAILNDHSMTRMLAALERAMRRIID